MRIYGQNSDREFYIISSFERTFERASQNVDKSIKSCEIPIIDHGETFFHTICKQFISSVIYAISLTIGSACDKINRLLLCFRSYCKGVDHVKKSNSDRYGQFRDRRGA